MLGILLLFFIGKFFYKLAEKYEKTKWGYAILGIITYYAGTFIYGVAYVFIFFMMYPDAYEDDMNELLMSLTAIPIGIASAYLLYYLLEKNWKKNAEKDRVSIDDIGKGI